MADLGKQFLDTDGLNALWTKHKKVQPFYQEIGTSGTNGWVNFLTVKGTPLMNHPLVVRLLCRGYSDSTMDVQFASANNTTPTIQYFKQRIQPYSGTQAIAKPGYTYEDVDGVRYYKFWLKKNEGYGSIGVHVESEYFYINGAEDTGILTFPNVQSDTEPSGIVYVANADIVYEAVPAKTAVSAAAVKVGTNAIGQVVIGNALAPSDLGISATTTSVTVGSTTANIPQATTTTPKMDGTAAVGTETKWAKGDHVHPTDTSRAPTSHASSATTYGVGTTANYGHVKLATGDMNGATHADGVAVSKNHTHGQYVPTTRTVNGHALSADVTVTAADVSAVRYDTASQGLTDTQKSNARTNIGAGTSNLTLGTTSTTAAKGDHTHTTSIASDSSSGTVVTLAHNTQYKLTAGGTSVLFKTPTDSNTDTKVTQTKDDSGTTAYPLLMAGAADPNGTATTARYDSAVKLTPSTNTISANISGNAATATSAGKLTTARELAVSLSNTSTTTTFDGSANVTNIKVSGQLPVANGGTGSNTAAGARTNLSVYSKSEIDSLMSGRVEIVTELPATGKSGVTYYVGPTGSGADKYDEYLWTGSAFLKVGEHSLDLSNYVNTVNTSGSGSVVTGVSKSGNTVTVTKGNISLDDLSDWATETDVTISNVTYHTMWPVAPTSSNQVYGISINGGRLFRIYNNKGAYSVQAYDKDSDTTYTPQKLGSGYGTCTTAEATAAKVVTLADYVLAKNGIVAVKFSYPLCASATLNINGKGAKPVYVGGAAVTATNCKSVQAGDIGYFIYDGTAYHFLGTDRADKSSITGLSVSGKTVTYTRADGETGTFDTQDTTYSFADSYNASTNKGATVATVTNAINALDVTDISGFGAGKTLATLKEENGKISATFQNISITKSQVSDFSHTHGNIQNGGTLQTNDITIANGDKLVVTDSSDSSKVARASISFDGSTTTKALTQKGTFEAFAKSGDITTAIQALDVSSVGGSGKYISAISETDGKISATSTTMDTTPTANSEKAVTSGGIKTALDGKQNTLPTTGAANDTYAINVSGKAYQLRSIEVKSPQSDKCWAKIAETTTNTTTDYHIAFSVHNDGYAVKSAYIGILSASIQQSNQGTAGRYAVYFYRADAVEFDAIKAVLVNTGTVLELWVCNKRASQYIYFTPLHSLRLSPVYGQDRVYTQAEFEAYISGKSYYPSVEKGINRSGTDAVGSSSIPVWVDANGTLTQCTDDFVHDGDVASTYSATGTAPVNGTAVASAISGKVSKSGDTMTGGLEIQGVKSGTSYAQSGGGYNANYNNIILRGDPTYGTSGILFTSSKGTTSVNQVTDRGFIQFHSMGVTPVAEASTPTMATSGEANSLVIGVGNDSDDQVWLQAPSTTGIKHLIGATKYTIYDAANLPAATSASAVATTSSAGSASTFSRGDHVHSLPLAASGTRGGIQIGYSESGTNYAVKLSSEKAYVTVPWTDTKNTAGSTDTSSKIFLIGATSQAANPQTYSQDTTYVDTDATLASTKVRVAEKCTLQFNTTTNALDFVFA